ncbi:MAG: hypothetical protein ONB44_01805 [candidate division KSB1 bacterium]|nr:hypothetical protein [candidate division KSB1 bacterium]MDZ7300856.1 hypothetical protein [candidate division KSB1 bacterium]MDZ7309874.1 hypothetical protein [candidate division KSB1 bacterium]
MEFVGSLHKRYVTQWQSERKNERENFVRETAKFIFGVIHLKLDFSASPEDYSRAMELALENARKLALVFFPDLTEKELQGMWNKFIEAN